MATVLKSRKGRLRARTIAKSSTIPDSGFRREWMAAVVFILLAIFAVGTRFWALGATPMHHDEAVFAYRVSWLLAGGDYDYDPSRHGPFPEYVTALFFRLFGDNEATARLLPAISGILIILLVWRMRDLLGNLAGFSAFVLLAVSPTMMYFSRYRNDMPFTLAALVFVCCGMRFKQKHETRYWFYTLVALAWMVCLKEAYLMILLAVAMFAAIYFAARRIRTANRNRAGSGENDEQAPDESLRGFLRSVDRSRLIAATLLGLFAGLLMIVTLFSNFLQHPEHAAGPIEALIQWSGRNVEHKIYGEFHYYVPLLIIYEFLPLGIFVWGLGRLLRYADLVRPRWKLTWLLASLRK